MGVGVQHQTPVALPPRMTRYPSWVGSTAGLDGCGKSRPQSEFDPRIEMQNNLKFSAL